MSLENVVKYWTEGGCQIICSNIVCCELGLDTFNNKIPIFEECNVCCWRMCHAWNFRAIFFFIQTKNAPSLLFSQATILQNCILNAQNPMHDSKTHNFLHSLCKYFIFFFGISLSYHNLFVVSSNYQILLHFSITTYCGFVAFNSFPIYLSKTQPFLDSFEKVALFLEFLSLHLSLWFMASMCPFV